jgi:hypothetical protein
MLPQPARWRPDAIVASRRDGPARRSGAFRRQTQGPGIAAGPLPLVPRHLVRGPSSRPLCSSAFLTDSPGPL